MSGEKSSAWPQVAVMGAGAVGCYFGGMLARAGARVTLIGRRAHVEAVARDGLFIDSIHFRERVEVAGSTQPDAARDAAFILFCVKTLDTEKAACALKPHLAPGATVLSLQNGVDNVQRIRSASGVDALPAVVYVAVEMTAPGRVKHSGRGDLVVGCLPDQEDRNLDVSRFVDLFARAGVPCRVSENIQADLWTKLAFNCAGNAVTTLSRSSYGQAARHPLAREVMRAVVDEAVAVARAAGIHLPDSSLAEEGLKIAEKMGSAISSTAQDIARGKRTEIDSLNGYLVRRGHELGVPTPVNHTLYALIKLLEESGFQAGSA